jgi:hypothetical protein
MSAETFNLTSPGNDQPQANGATEGASGSNPLLEPYLNQRVSSKKSTGKTDASSASSPSTSTPGADSKAAETGMNPPNEWTVVADLAILFDNVGKSGHMGAEEKLHNLQALTDSTKGKPLTIIADVLVNDGSDVPGQPLSKSKKGYEVERVIIHDGKETILPAVPSQGTQKDLQNLIEYSLKNAPSNKVALAINAHGLGNQGVEGGMLGRGNGLVPVEDLSSTIQSALKSGGRDKLDLVDLDSCLMAQQGVLQQLAPVTNDLVASEAVETVSTNPADIDGQNLGKWIGDLVQNPSMTGVQLGKQIVAEANQNANGYNFGPDGRDNVQGTRTLTNFDLSQMLEFNDKLNALGVQLTKALADPASRSVIQNQIHLQQNITNDSLLHPDQGGFAAKIDLFGFVHQLSVWTSDGNGRGIADPDHKLKAALSDMESYLQDRNKLLDATHTPVALGIDRKPIIPAYNNLSGLSAYVPDATTGHSPQQIKARQYVNDIESGANNQGWNIFLNALQ